MIKREHRSDSEDKAVYKSKNLEAERRRRQKLNDRLLKLRSLVPNITDMKKETVIEDAITYIRQLKGRVLFLCDQVLQVEPLEEEETKPKIDENAAEEMKNCGIELRINIIFGKKRGNFTKLVEAMNALGFVFGDTSVTTLKGATLFSSVLELIGRAELR
ncbi:hypothetical protein CICLE_v10012974mg [Citrus x clementina]|uniref:BHLH domain-containing protein n=1 Tax=Citrus clementina TaxID=85681 RepID=V4T2X2_CITCL|nr:hypothetical protein CICLE_v10012974mg [Citrus x clementina]